MGEFVEHYFVGLTFAFVRLLVSRSSLVLCGIFCGIKRSRYLPKLQRRSCANQKIGIAQYNEFRGYSTLEDGKIDGQHLLSIIPMIVSTDSHASSLLYSSY